jgi:hypothetical protein
LESGDLVRTPAGATAAVVSVRAWTQVQEVYNLTVEGIHTYFVFAGDVPLLVHNCSKSGPAFGGACTCASSQQFARLGTSKESTGRLASQAQAAANNPKGFGHGVSVRPVDGPMEGASVFTKQQAEEAGFSLIFTPTRDIPMHHTLILPRPVDSTVAKAYNRMLGRK